MNTYLFSTADTIKYSLFMATTYLWKFVESLPAHINGLQADMVSSDNRGKLMTYRWRQTGQLGTHDIGINR